MRLSDRLARLEHATAEYPRPTSDEMDAAEERFRSSLLRDGVPGGGSVQSAVDGWHRIVAGCAPWARQVYLNVQPEDLYA